MMSDTSILLQGGTILSHNSDDTITPLKNTDLLIEGNTITQIEPNINPPASTRTIDCHGKIITPGFIDTHHHLWQTQLKGRFNNDTLLDYMPRGNMACYVFTPSDLYIGQLSGCLEALDAGTTTVVDHAHGAYSAEHATQAINATVDSGLRCFYCYSYVLRIDKWDMEQCVPNQDIMPEWATEQMWVNFPRSP
jgi:cytosine/adenosine deaminase-related metal-dependent hydrolase